ncbi:MAG: hypothetical protein R3F59_08105 [Myxococcota bacterium]
MLEFMKLNAMTAPSRGPLPWRYQRAMAVAHDVDGGADHPRVAQLLERRQIPQTVLNMLMNGAVDPVVPRKVRSVEVRRPDRRRAPQGA